MLWGHASSAAKQSYRKIAQQVGIRDWDNPKIDVLSLVHGWLANEHNEKMDDGREQRRQ